jgi:hypothetical protein
MAVNEGVKRVYEVKVASGATSTAEVDLGAHYSRALIGIPTSWTGGDVRLQVAENTGGTFKSLYGSTTARWSVSAAVSGAFVPVENVGRYVKIESSSAPSADSTFYIIGVE